ncbi:MAG: hypothetical protein WC166_06480 [Bacteroidales bacterium]
MIVVIFVLATFWAVFVAAVIISMRSATFWACFVAKPMSLKGWSRSKPVPYV